MTYRDSRDSLEAQIGTLEADLALERAATANLKQRVGRAERALAAYRRTGAAPERDVVARAVRVLVVCGILVWASGVLWALAGHDKAAGALAASSAVFSALAPLVAWTSARRLMTGVAALAPKLGFAFLITFNASTGSSAHDSWVALFWAGPATLLVAMLVEAWLIAKTDVTSPETRTN